MKFFQHLKTVIRHRRLVRQGCFRVGLYWQGLTHDLSKFAPVEFMVGARLWQGNRSPNTAEREEKGYSEAWIHHKGRNRHHYEYWSDLNPKTRRYESVPMPRKYLVEMVMDRRAACMTYQGKAYTDASALNYFLKSMERDLMHPQTRRELEFLLTMLKNQGEDTTFRYLKHHVLRGKPFPWEEKSMDRNWLKTAIFYEIYPQSFYDTNGDGIGDIPGIIEKLDYVKSIGCNALWLNPWYDSPMTDAGYDVRDHKAIHPRYGTLEDARALFRIAHEKGLHVLIDLVPGHTSQEHPWFRASAQEQPEAEFKDRYIWTSNAFCRGDGMPFIGGESPRDGTYIINFFKCQPALNYGWREIHEPDWQQKVTDPAPMATREAMKDILRFWLEQGCDGFRVDMADSLVKNDGDDKLGTMEVWKDITADVRRDYPHMALVSEWNNPGCALHCGFDMDFCLDWYGNSYSRLARYYQLDGQTITKDESYFKADSGSDPMGFLADFLPKYEARGEGLYCLITGNHDCKRTSFNLNDTERKLLYAFLLTMPGAPFIYYGDEIGQAYRFLPTREGGYHRTGSRTPMQWDNGKNLGFSTAEPEQLYLSVDPDPGNATVAAQEADPDSMLNHIRALLKLRSREPELGNYSDFAPVYAQAGRRPFLYRRGELLVAVNPGLAREQLLLEDDRRAIYTFGSTEIQNRILSLEPQSFVVLKKI